MKEKPRCAKCGQHHWMFVGCEQVDEVEAREAEKQAAETPLIIYRQPSSPSAPKLKNFHQVAPGVFVRSDSPLKPAA